MNEMNESAQLALIVLGIPFLFCVMCTIVAAVSANASRTKLKIKKEPGFIAKTFVIIAKSIAKARRARKDKALNRAQSKPKLVSPFNHSELENSSALLGPATFPAPTPEPAIAVKHRCFRGKGGRKIFVADYSDSISTATVVKKNGRRTRLGESPTSPDTDKAFIQQANGC